MVRIGPNTKLPARREAITLHTEDGLRLVGELALPADRAPVATVVLLHPLPTHGGMMDSHVLRKAAFRLPALAGLAVLRFNTRGAASEAGRSEGTFGAAEGEGFDVAAALDFVRSRGLPRVWLAGWSFGSDLALMYGIDGHGGMAGAGSTAGMPGIDGRGGTEAPGGTDGVGDLGGTSGADDLHGPDPIEGAGDGQATGVGQGTGGGQATGGVEGAHSDQATGGAGGAHSARGTDDAEGAHDSHGTVGTRDSHGTEGARDSHGTEGARDSRGTVGTRDSHGTVRNHNSRGTEGTVEARGSRDSPGTAGIVEGVVLIAPPLRWSSPVQRAAWASAGKPVVALVPEFDDYRLPEHVRQECAVIPQARVITLPGAGHLLVGHADAVLDHLVSIIAPDTPVPLPRDWDGECENQQVTIVDSQRR